MRSVIFISILLGGFYPAISQSQDIEVWTAQVPGSTLPKSEPELKPDRGDDVIRLTEITNPKLSIFLAPDSLATGMGVIICPGGGYQHLAVNKEGYEVAEWLNTLGISAFVLTYRVPNQQPGATQDLQRAVRIVRASGKQWQVDPDRLGVLGFSAGAHLAVMAQESGSQATYPPMDDLDALGCGANFTLLIYPGGFHLNEDDVLPPSLMPDGSAIPTFIFATADDPHASSALNYGSALQKKKLPVTLHLLPTGGHGYGLRPGNPAAEAWPRLAEEWLADIK